MNMLPDEAECLDYQSTIRLPHGYLSIRCGDKERGAVTVGTLFHNTDKPLRPWLQAREALAQRAKHWCLSLRKILGGVLAASGFHLLAMHLASR